MGSIRDSDRGARAGAVAAQAALSLFAVLGVLAFAVDGGSLLAEHQHAQATADAAALAAGADLFAHYVTNSGLDPSGTAKASALATASANGYTNDGANSAVTVSISPQNYQSGPKKGTQLPAGYAEVLVTYNQKRFFSSIWSASAIPVSARAVARGQWVSGSLGVVVMNPTGTGDNCDIEGKLVMANGAKLVVNSDLVGAVTLYKIGNITFTDTKGNSWAGQFDLGQLGALKGTIVNTVGTSALPTGMTQNWIPSIPSNGDLRNLDPLANVPEPVPSGTNYGAFKFANGVTSVTIQPGIYTDIHVPPNVQLTMAPGIYYLQKNGIKLGTNATLTGDKVMIYNQSGDNLDVSPGGAVNLTPPTSGPYKGISIFQPRGDNSAIQIKADNDQTITITGTLYAGPKLNPDGSLAPGGEGGKFDLRPRGSAVFKMGSCICWAFEVSKGGETGTVIMNSTPGSTAPTQRNYQLVE